MSYSQPVTAPYDEESRPRSSAWTRGTAGVLALVLAVGVWLVQQLAVQTATGQRLDDRVRTAVVAAAGDGLEDLARQVGYAGFNAALILAVALALTAVVRVRPDQLVLLAVTVGGANVTTQVLKHVLIERPALTESAPNSLPSGHLTVVASVALVTMLLTGAWARKALVVLGTLVTLAMAAAVVLAGWHRPSDVVAAALVCGCFAALAVAVVGPGDQASRWA